MFTKGGAFSSNRNGLNTSLVLHVHVLFCGTCKQVFISNPNPNNVQLQPCTNRLTPLGPTDSCSVLYAESNIILITDNIYSSIATTTKMLGM